MIITTTNNIEGYKVIAYLGIVSVVNKPGTFATKFSRTVGEIVVKTEIESAIKQLEKEALGLGANAIIGMDLDIDLGTNNSIVANGTAVVIEQLNSIPQELRF